MRNHPFQLPESMPLSFSAVAEESSFASVYHFSRLFRRHTGMSPTACRQLSLY